MNTLKEKTIFFEVEASIAHNYAAPMLSTFMELCGMLGLVAPPCVFNHAFGSPKASQALRAAVVSVLVSSM